MRDWSSGQILRTAIADASAEVVPTAGPGNIVSRGFVRSNAETLMLVQGRQPTGAQAVTALKHDVAMEIEADDRRTQLDNPDRSTNRGRATQSGSDEPIYW